MNWEIAATSHVGSDGIVLSKTALDDMARQINDAPLRQLLEHDVTLPPIGIADSAVVIQMPDGHFALTVRNSRYEIVRELSIESEGFVELAVPNESRALLPSWHDNFGGPLVSIDPKAIPNIASLREWGLSLGVYTDLKKDSHVRRSMFPDPEIIVNLGNLLWGIPPSAIVTYFVLKTGKKAADTAANEIGQDIGERIAKAYKLLFELPASFARSVVDTLRTTTFIGVLPGNPDVVFVIKSADAEVFERGANLAEIATCHERAEKLKEEHQAVEVHFVYNQEEKWRLNYFITDTGRVFGSRMSIARRDKVERLLEEVARDRLDN